MATTTAKKNREKPHTGVAAFFRSMMTTDLRSLALFRVSIGFVVLIDVLDRMIDAQKYYTDFGLFPRDMAVKYGDFQRFAVLQMMNGQLWFQYLLIAIHIVFIIFFIVGYRTRLSTIVVWFMSLSLQSRDVEVGYCVDVVMRMGLLWGAFLPLGDRFSIDRALNPNAPQGSNRHSGPAILGLFTLITSIYLFTAILKGQNASWIDGYGPYYALSMDEYVMPLGRLLTKNWTVLKLSNYATLVMEAVGWLPLFFPWRKEILRFPLFFIFLAFHIGMGLSLNVTLFQLAAIATWTCVLPEAFWTFAERNWAKRGHDFITGFFSRNVETLKNLQKKYHFSLGQVSVPIRHPRAWNSLAVVILGVCIYWNLRVSYPTIFPFLAPVENVALAFGIDQRWDMFASPADDSGWFVIPGVLHDGSKVDLFKNGADVDWTKPENIYKQFRDERLRKTMLRIAGFDSDHLRMAYGAYLCRWWNENHESNDRKLEAFKIVFLQQMILREGGLAPPKVLMLWQHECNKGLLEKWKTELDESSFKVTGY
jgi:hypothetical protein